MSSNSKINDEKRLLLNDLINVTREITSKYNGGKQMVTEQSTEVAKLLHLVEKTICFGLKNHSLLGNVQDLFSSSSNNGNLFWSFAYQHLTKHEQERFTNYKNVSDSSANNWSTYPIKLCNFQLWTDRGKTKALIRNALNEHCLERYLLTWMSAENLNEFYESFSLLRDEKAAAILPKLASDLSSILFAISIDVPELNVASSKPAASKPEPIIAVPNSSQVVKSSTGNHRRNIDEFEETVKAHEVTTPVIAETSSSPFRSPLENLTPVENIPNFSDKISISTESSTESPSNSNMKDDDTISQSSTSSEEHSAVQNADPERPVNTNNQIDKDIMIMKQRDRIMELEGQVLDLTLENSRLRNLLSSTKVNTLSHFQISIPRAVLQKSTTKNFYIYEINFRSKNGSESWTIFKRYRDFHKLHKQLKKRHLQIKVLDFPPKKNIGNLDFDFVEERRQRLQVYIRHVLQNLPELASCDSRTLLEAKCSFFKS